jgi:protein CpxP
MSNLLKSILLTAGLAVAAAPLLAQESTPPAKDRGAQQQRQAKGNPTERVEARLTELKSQLKITSAQEPQWNAFADTLRKQARAGAERRSQMDKGGKGATMTAIQRLEQRQAFMKDASTRLDEVLASARPLYAALSTEQKKVADDLMAKQGGRGGHRGPGGGDRPARG